MSNSQFATSPTGACDGCIHNVGIKLTLTQDQAEYLKDILDWWIEDTADAADKVMDDADIASFEELLVAAADIKMMHREAKEIRDNLWSGISGRHDSPSTA